MVDALDLASDIVADDNGKVTKELNASKLEAAKEGSGVGGILGWFLSCQGGGC